MDIKAIALAAAAGAALPIQIGINTTLARHGAGAVWAAMVSFGVGTVGLAGVFLFQRVSLPPRAELAAAPWWAWTGGLLGAFYVASSIWAAPRLGAALLFALVVGGQMVMSAGLDHTAALGLPHEPFTLLKGAGIALIIAGVVLVQR